RDDPTTTSGTVSGWGNVERIGAKGLEFQSSWRAHPHLTLDFNGAYNLAKYETEWLAQSPELPAPNRYFDLKGEQVSGVPKVILSYGFNYQRPVGGFLGRLTLNNTYRSAAYLSDNHAAFSHQDAYNVTNLGIGLGSLDRSWEISLLGRNVFDTGYYTTASTWTNTAAQSVTWGAPRTWMVVFKSKI
ncbi:MAG: TonB-dependent receptor, partial [Zoogloeaceae bacterium]|nr:TonB-dependent receptor [Zoogloeaceae bacterium]